MVVFWDIPILPRVHVESLRQGEDTSLSFHAHAWKPKAGRAAAKDPHRAENKAGMNDNRNAVDSDTEWKGDAGVEVGCKAACRGSSKGRQAKVA